MSFRESDKRLGSYRPLIAIAVIMAGILAPMGNAVLSQEVMDQKPRKPRLEKTELTLKDNKTRLVWPLNANLAERKFSWSHSFDALDRIVNKESFAGFHDWRVPTKEELMTLVELARSQGYDGNSPESSIIAGLASLGFQNVQDEEYWSSSENLYFAAEARVVDMTDGTASFADKTLYFNLWPVRSAN
jgi:hypothetical protein